MNRYSTPFQPTAAGERIELLDALRAVALLGIFLVNLPWFTRPWQEVDRGILPGLEGVDYALAWGLHVFVAGKFWIMFSILFGAGFALMAGRAQAAGVSSRPYVRRMLALLALGVAHALLLWVGDILHTYAVAGLLMLAFRDLAPRSQLMAGLLIFAAGAALNLLVALGLMVAPDDVLAGMRAQAAAESALGLEAAGVYGNGGFAAITAQRLADFSTLVAMNVLVVPLALAMFLIGSWLLRSGLLRDVAAHQRFFLRLAASGLTLGLGLTLWSASIEVTHPHGMVESRAVFAASLHQLAALPLSLGYIALAALAWQSRGGQRVLSAVAPAGRMALTNYLGQSLLASLVFYGYGLALWGRVDPAGLVLLALVVFVLQVLASRWWLGRYRFGPLEWLWRWLTYGTRPVLRRQSSGA
ncbi:DUF418 domain-containing protein [Luteimonas sp. A277]